MKKYTELIEKLENNELSEKEKEDFFNELTSNPKLKDEFEFNEKLANAIRNNKLEEFKKILDKAHKKFEEEN